MTITLVLIAGLALVCVFVAGCIVGHRVAGSEMSDSARRWEATYAENRGPIHPSKPAGKDTMNQMAAAHMERVMTKEGWGL